LIGDRVAVDLDRMQRAATNAIAFAGGMSKVDFLDDTKTQAAVMMCMIIIGEAGSRIAAQSPDFVASHPEMPWREMRGVRNRGAHDYDTIDFAAVWDMLQTSLPALLSGINALGPIDPRLRENLD
jgi:uncharacterized protein with HEPN domain